MKIHQEKQDDSAMDFGGEGLTWCAACGAVYGTPEWRADCKPLRALARIVKNWKQIAKRVGMEIKAVRWDDGDHFHSFQCEDKLVEVVDGKIWPHQYHSGSIYEPPSDEWEPIDSPFDNWDDALHWLVEASYTQRLYCAIEDQFQWAAWKEDSTPV